MHVLYIAYSYGLQKLYSLHHNGLNFVQCFLNLYDCLMTVRVSSDPTFVHPVYSVVIYDYSCSYVR